MSVNRRNRHHSVKCRAAMAAALAIALATQAPVAVAGPASMEITQADDPKSTEQAIEDATRSMMEVLDMILKAIPQYEAPEILDNGDIIIRRIHPQEDNKDAPAPPEDEPHQTRT